MSRKVCHVVLSAPKPTFATKLWIDAKTLLIVKTHESFSNRAATYHPKPNAEIPAAEFEFKPPR